MRSEKEGEGIGEDLSPYHRDHCSGTPCWYHFIHSFQIFLNELLCATALAEALLPKPSPRSFLADFASQIEVCFQGSHILQVARPERSSNLSPEEQPGSPFVLPHHMGSPASSGHQCPRHARAHLHRSPPRVNAKSEGIDVRGQRACEVTQQQNPVFRQNLPGTLICKT